MKFGLIGHPIEHSLSPALFRAGYGGRYPYDLIQTDSFEEAYRRFIEGYDGINVTAPFKEPALAKADIVTEESRLVGASNLLMKTPEGITAYNSDYRGLCVWLRELLERSEGAGSDKSVLPPWPQGVGPTTQSWEGFFCHSQPPLTVQQSERNVLIVGMGGAGKAAAAAAWSTGISLTLMNRDMSKAEEMACRLRMENKSKDSGCRTEDEEGDRKIETRPLSDFCECFRKANIIIYNLPVRLPELDGLTTQDFQSTSGVKHILEANYRNPSFNARLLKRMKEANPRAEYTPGQTWLLLQAVTGYEIFTGERPDLSAMSAQI
jgi:shikimate 5-dehydrogenase